MTSGLLSRGVAAFLAATTFCAPAFSQTAASLQTTADNVPPIVSGACVRRSLLFSSVRVDNGTSIEDSVVLPGVRIGRDVVLRKAVVDKRCVIGDGMRIGVDVEADRKRFYVSPGGVTLVTPEQLGQNIHATR